MNPGTSSVDIHPERELNPMHRRNIRPETRMRNFEQALFHLVLSYHVELHPRIPGNGYGGWSKRLVKEGVPLELSKQWLEEARDEGWRMTDYEMPPNIQNRFQSWQRVRAHGE
jgi:hypothetical protein